MTAKRKGPGGRRVGAGRKPLPPEERRDRPVFVRLTRDEETLLSDAAAGEPLAAWIRDAALRAARRRERG